MVRENNKEWQLYYIGRDYLGSITHVIDESGAVQQELSYDAWGRLRNPQTQTVYPTAVQPEPFLARGYTGHEHLTRYGLVNMNARLYDPATSRFLSPDLYVQSPTFTQSYNRYSYAFNNPLKYVDPTGEVYYEWDHLSHCYRDELGNRADYSDVFRLLFRSGYFRPSGSMGDGTSYGGGSGGYGSTGYGSGYPATIYVPENALSKYMWIPYTMWISYTILSPMSPSEQIEGADPNILGEYQIEAISVKLDWEAKLKKSMSAWALPSTYSYKNGEQITAPDGTRYQLYNNQWVKVGGAQVDINLYMHVGNTTGYFPSSHPAYVDQKIMMRSARNQLVDGIDPLGTAIGLASSSLPKIGSKGTVIAFGLNMAVGSVIRYNESKYHDEQVETMRNPK
jgi:RHS repeat-associated protein